MADPQEDWNTPFAAQAAGPAAPTGEWSIPFAASGPAAPVPPAQMPSGPGRAFALGGKAALTGLEGVAGLPGSAENLYNALTPKGGNIPAKYILPNAEQLDKKLGKYGAGQANDLIPQNAVERYGSAIVAGAAPALLAGPAGLSAAFSGAAGGASAQAATDLGFKSPWAQIAAGVLGGTAAQGITSLLAGNTVEKIASSLGSSTTLQQAGTALQDAARNWKSVVMPQKLEEVSAPLAAAVASDAPVELGNYQAILKDITNRAGDLQGSADVLTPGGAKRLAAAMDVRNQLASLTGTGEAPTTWANARAFRSVLGEAMSDPALVKDVGEKNLEALYSGLSQDLGVTAEKAGAGSLWQNFNQKSTELYRFASDKLSKVISSDDPRVETIAPENVASKLLSGGKKGATDLAALREQIPEGVDELAAAHLRSAKPWASLSPEAKETLVTNPAWRKLLTSAVPKAVSGLGAQNNMLTAGVGGFIGSHLVPLALSTLGGSTATDAGALAGAALPLLYQGGKSIVNNPLTLTGPVAGGLAGSAVSRNP